MNQQLSGLFRRVYLVFVFMSFLLSSVACQPSTGLIMVERDTSQYIEILSSFGDWVVIEHFPKQIPESATKVFMVYVPRFLQGALVFQLRMILPEKEIISLREQISTEAAQITDSNQVGKTSGFIAEDVPLPR